mgnify:CR=1 FL=1
MLKINISIDEINIFLFFESLSEIIMFEEGIELHLNLDQILSIKQLRNATLLFILSLVIDADYLIFLRS